MTQRTMQQAVERLADDHRFARRFRQDPELALRRYRLDAAQVQAIKSGDADVLAAHGVDVVALANGRRKHLRGAARKMLAALTVMTASLGFGAAPAGAARFGARALGARIDGIWNLGHASERSGQELHANTDHVQVPTDGAPGQGRPFHLNKGS